MVGGALRSASMDDFDLRMSEKARPLYEAVKEFIRTEHADMRDKLVKEAALTDEIEGMLKKALEAFVARLSAKA